MFVWSRGSVCGVNGKTSFSIFYFLFSIFLPMFSVSFPFTFFPFHFFGFAVPVMDFRVAEDGGWTSVVRI